MEHVDRLSDPKVVGPGVWWMTHMLARDAIDKESIDKFIKHMNFLAANFSCKNCRKHINEYMRLHSFDDLKNLKNKDGELIGMFKWTWLFHNAVNTRIGKPYIEWETAVEMFYTEPEVCSKNCEEVDNNHEIKPELNEPEIVKINNLPSDLSSNERKSKLAQGYFMSVGIPNTLKKNGVLTDSKSWVSFASV
jgi:hypothetical protein